MEIDDLPKKLIFFKLQILAKEVIKKIKNKRNKNLLQFSSFFTFSFSFFPLRFD